MGGFFWFLIGAGTATIWSHNTTGTKLGSVDGRSTRKEDTNGEDLGRGDMDGMAGSMDRIRILSQPPVMEQQGYTTERQAYSELPPSPDKERIRELSRQAGDAMSELSEATLDTLMSTILAAKNKLADRRIQRDLEEKRVADAAEREKRFPPRYV
ncbi:hypothetical protein IW262DRAFT_1463747 [Armillaria fumosa]|nr:hypothetical protein IW262DRAFT_1463747 [Armillaria fumosa]